MGFFDREVMSSFDSMFDLNGDGVLEGAELALQMEFLKREMEGQEDNEDEDDD